MYYRQCVLCKGETSQTVWLPELHAVIGKCLRIKDEDGWVVTSISKSRRPEYQLLTWEREYAKHRQVTDI